MPEENEIILVDNFETVRDEHPVPEHLLNLSEQEVKAIIAESNLNQVRSLRDSLLAETDWTQQGDVPESTKLKWQPYRQALRDITDHYSSIDKVVWPTKPV